MLRKLRLRQNNDFLIKKKRVRKYNQLLANGNKAIQL